MINEVLNLQLDERIKKVVKSFTLVDIPRSGKQLVVDLNGRYDNRKAISDFDQNSWKYSQRNLKEALQFKNVDNKDITQILDALDNNYASILEKISEAAKREDKDQDNDKKKESTKVLELLYELGVIYELFKDDLDRAFATVYIASEREDVDSHLETLPVYSSRFEKWICRIVYKEKFKTLSGETLNEITRNLAATAEYDGMERHLDIRVNSIEEEPFTYYYDLVNPNWQVVRVTRAGWSIENHSSDNSPTLFRRYPSQSAQVFPAQSKSYPDDIFDQFFRLVNIKNDGDRDLILLLQCYIISLFVPEISKVVLILYGSKGSAKTAFEWMIKLLVDPCPGKIGKPSLLTPPDRRETFVQQMAHNYVVFYDNIQYIKSWLSDALCRAATGTADSKRALYTNDDDFLYQYLRCAGLNGINLSADRADLLDRSILAGLERIDPKKRRDFESDIMAEFERQRPQLLAYIFDILVKVLKMKAEGGIKLDEKSRMADWEVHAEMISRCMGNEPMRLVNAYKANRDLATGQALESSPIAAAIIAFMEGKEEWIGSTTKLLAELEDIAVTLRINTQRDKRWPKGARVLSLRLEEVKVDLAEIGIVITSQEHSGSTPKQIIIHNITSLHPSPPKSQDEDKTNEETH